MGVKELGEEKRWVALEGFEVSGGSEERAGEGVVEAGNRDEHHGTGGPDVQVVRGDGEGGRGGRGDPELAPQSVDVGLFVIYPGVFHHVVPCCGVGAVGTY